MILSTGSAVFIKKQKNQQIIKIQFIKNKLIIDHQCQQKQGQYKKYVCVLGIILLAKKPYLLVASEVKRVGFVGFNAIYQILATKWIPIDQKNLHFYQQQSIKKQLQMIQAIFQTGGHYYSLTYDLSRPYSLNMINKNVDNQNYYKQFQWNYYLRRFNNDSLLNFIPVVIQGAFNFASTDTPSGSISFTLISRRSRLKTGTRFLARGIDSMGNTANFVETEQIVAFGQHICSFLMLRGSVPLFFEQNGIDGISSKLTVVNNLLNNTTAFIKHFQMLQQIYKRIFCLNLLCENKSSQQNLTEHLEDMIERENLPFLKYKFFDFHTECGSDFSKVTKLVQSLTSINQLFSTFVYNISQKKVISIQNGIHRVNCLDCLDRTNFVQSRLALQSLQLMFKSLRKSSRIMKQNSPPLEKFNQVWAQNGDKLSISYTGVGSTHTDITRTGERTMTGFFTHKTRSLQRFFMQFTDNQKHQAIQNFLLAPSSLIFQNHTYSCRILSIQLEYQSNIGPIIRDFLESFPQIFVVFVYDSCFMKKQFKKMTGFEEEKSSSIQSLQVNVCTQIVSKGYSIVTKIKSQRCLLQLFVKNQIAGNIKNIKDQKQQLDSECLLIQMKIGEINLSFLGVFCQQFLQFNKFVQKMKKQKKQIITIFGNIGSKSTINKKNLTLMHQKIIQLQKNNNFCQIDEIINQALLEDDFGKLQLTTSAYKENLLSFLPLNNRIFFKETNNKLVTIKNYGQDIKKGIRTVYLNAIYTLQKQ